MNQTFVMDPKTRLRSGGLLPERTPAIVYFIPKWQGPNQGFTNLSNAAFKR